MRSAATLLLTFLAFVQLVRSTCNPPTADPTAPSAFPYLSSSESGFLASDVLTIVFRAAQVSGRPMPNISFVGYTDGNCNAVGGTGVNWAHTQDSSSCEDVYTASLPWSLASSSCGLAQLNSSNVIEYDGTILFHQVDNLGTIRNQVITRTSDSPFNIAITFQRDVQVNTSDPVIFAPVAVDAAVTYVGYNQGSATGIMRLYTSVQWPFEINSFNVSYTGQGAPVVSVFANNSCASSSDCDVTWEVDVTSMGCSLNGTFTLFYQVICNPLYTASDCPLQPGTDYAQITVVSNTGNFCGTFTEAVHVTANINSYTALGASQTRNAFLQNQVMYFRANASSSKVSLVMTHLLNCSALYNSGSTLLWNGGSSSSNGTAQNGFGMVIDSISATDVWFHVNATNSLFPLAADASASAVISCWLGIEYSNVVTSKRSISYINSKMNMASAVEKRQASGSTENAVSAIVQLETLPQASSSSSGNNTPFVESAASSTDLSLLMAAFAVIVSLACTF